LIFLQSPFAPTFRPGKPMTETLLPLRKLLQLK
jgi:hypothetical protein